MAQRAREVLSGIFGACECEDCLDSLLTFAARVRDEERERCAQIAEPTWAAAAIRGEGKE
jgi:hypothetical protein